MNGHAGSHSHAALARLQEEHPNIPILYPGQDGYSERRKTRGNENSVAVPLAISVPKNAKHVAALVTVAVSNNIKVIVRSGGNEFYGRNMQPDALVIDMRHIDFVQVSQDKRTAKVGGGIISNNLVRELEGHGLITPFGNFATVGYVGWATLGGYGPLTAAYGMGYEQIVGAEIVNDKGELVEADEEILEGLRGMGGNLGIVTSLTIKVYPAVDLHSGVLVLGSSDLPKTMMEYQTKFDQMELPKEVTLHSFIIQNPNFGGKALVILWTWVGGNEQKAQADLEAFVKQMPTSIKINTVSKVTAVEHQQRSLSPCESWGAQRSIMVRNMTPKLLKILAEALEDMPTDAGVNMGWGYAKPRDSSVKGTFTLPEPHCMVSFAYMVEREDNLKPAKEWNLRLFDRIRREGGDVVMDCAYIPLSPPGDFTAEQLFAKSWPRAKALKKKYDQNGVFDLAIPRFSG